MTSTRAALTAHSGASLTATGMTDRPASASSFSSSLLASSPSRMFSVLWLKRVKIWAKVERPWWRPRRSPEVRLMRPSVPEVIKLIHHEFGESS